MRIEFSLKLPQELRQIIEYCPGNESHIFFKNGFQHFCQKLNFNNGFTGNRLGQNVRNHRGMISDFHDTCDFDSCFTCQSPCFHGHLDFHSLHLNNFFLFGGQICEAFISLEYRI